MHARVKVFCSSDSLGHWSSDPACATASPVPCHCTHIAPHTARSPNSRWSREEAGRGAETLQHAAFPCRPEGETSANEFMREKKPTKATQECVSAQLSSATVRARHIPAQCLREPRGGLLATLLAGRRGSHSSVSPPAPPAPERHVAGPTNAAETPVPRPGGAKRAGPDPTCGCPRPRGRRTGRTRRSRAAPGRSCPATLSGLPALVEVAERELPAGRPGPAAAAEPRSPSRRTRGLGGQCPAATGLSAPLTCHGSDVPECHSPESQHEEPRDRHAPLQLHLSRTTILPPAPGAAGGSHRPCRRRRRRQRLGQPRVAARYRARPGGYGDAQTSGSGRGESQENLLRGDGAGWWGRVGSGPLRSGRRRRAISPCRLGRRGATLRGRSVRPSVPAQPPPPPSGNGALGRSPRAVLPLWHHIMNMHEPGAHRPRSGESRRPPPPLRRPGTGPGLRAPGRVGRDGTGREGWVGRQRQRSRRCVEAAPPEGCSAERPGFQSAGSGWPTSAGAAGAPVIPLLTCGPSGAPAHHPASQGRRTWGPHRDSAPQAEALPGWAEPRLMHAAPPAPSPSAGPLQLLAPAALSSPFRPLLEGCRSPHPGGWAVEEHRQGEEIHPFPSSRIGSALTIFPLAEK